MKKLALLLIVVTFIILSIPTISFAKKGRYYHNNYYGSYGYSPRYYNSYYYRPYYQPYYGYYGYARPPVYISPFVVTPPLYFPYFSFGFVIR